MRHLEARQDETIFEEGDEGWQDSRIELLIEKAKRVRWELS